MFSQTQSCCSLACLFALFLSLGCNGSEEAPAAVTPTPKAATATEKTPQGSGSKGSEKKSDKEQAKAKQVSNSYTPPYPNRNNPFQPPMNMPLANIGNSRDQNSSVLLVGFANVGEPKVVLAIDGVVSPLSNGEEIAGVQVISIAPPNAVLQRGRNRWTASLPN